MSTSSRQGAAQAVTAGFKGQAPKVYLLPWVGLAAELQLGSRQRSGLAAGC